MPDDLADHHSRKLETPTQSGESQHHLRPPQNSSKNASPLCSPRITDLRATTPPGMPDSEQLAEQEKPEVAQFTPQCDVKQFIWTSEADKTLLLFTFRLDISALDLVHIADLIRSSSGTGPTISQVRDRVRVMQQHNEQKMRQFHVNKPANLNKSAPAKPRKRQKVRGQHLIVKLRAYLDAGGVARSPEDVGEDEDDQEDE